MSSLDPVIAYLGEPDPALPRLSMPEGSSFYHYWRKGFYPLESGYFRDGFLLFLAEGLDPLLQCAESWAFVTGRPLLDRMILGRTAHGTIFVLDHVTQPGADRVMLLDPLVVSYWGDPNLNFDSFLARAIPGGELDLVLDERVYREWRTQGNPRLGPDEILAPIVPLSLGGERTLENFQIENIYAYFEQTGRIYSAMQDGAD